MPEDNLVANPAFDATRAITIEGRPEDIWPWLAQMGYNRAGFYGYDLIENLGSTAGIRSATAILPALRNPNPGDPLPISSVASLEFGPIEPNRFLVWRGHGPSPGGVFIWQLVPLDGSHTRLISRIRWRYLKDPLGFSLGLFTEFSDHVAVRAILRGVRDRVEGRPPAPLWVQAAEIGCWLLALLDLLIAAVFVVRRRRWRRAWLLALGAGLLLQFVLYADEAVGVKVALTLPYTFLIPLLSRPEQASRARSASPGQTAHGGRA